MKADNYERVIENVAVNALVLDHHVSPCDESFIPNVTVRIPFETFNYLCFTHHFNYYRNCKRARRLCCT